MIGVIGLLLAITCLIVLSYRGVNAFIASLIASLVVIITNVLPFWGTFAGAYATGFKNFAGNYFLLFGLAAAYGEFMKVTGSAESVAAVLFRLFGVKWAPLAALLVTLLMAMGGISAFVIVFAVYPVAAPLFRKANITKALLPGIVLCASVTLCLCLPGNPTSTNALLARPEYGLGVNAFSAPVMGIIACVAGTVLAGVQLQCRRLGQAFAAQRVELDMSTLSPAVEALKGAGVDCVIVAAPQAFFPTVAGEMAEQDLCKPVLTTYLNSIITIAQATHQRVKGKFDLYALSWLNYQDQRLDNLEEAADWLGDYAMNGYAHCGWISAHFFCEGLRRMGPRMPRWEDFPAVMERAPLEIPFGGRVDYAGGKRMGTQDMSLVKLDLTAPTGWRFIDGLRSMGELLGTL